MSKVSELLKNRILWSFVVLVVVVTAAFIYFREQSLNRFPGLTLKQHARGGYSLLMDGKPYTIKGVCYLPTPASENVHFNFWAYPEIWRFDGKLMKEMGVNTIRIYREGIHPEEVRQVVSGFHREFGIRTMMGHDLGFWDWPPPNYGLPDFRAKVKQDVLEMVRRYQDEPGLFAWILGNENNYSFEVLNVQSWTTAELEAIEDVNERRKEKARIYYTFVNDLAKAIKEIDPLRPVIMGVGEVASLEQAAEVAQDIDIIGMIAYRGPGFGNLFRQIKQRFDKPVVMIEWGADSYHALNREEDQAIQAKFIQSQWKDIERNLAGNKGKGNVLGGTLFEWTDEWWKGNEYVQETWGFHEETGQFSNSAYYHDFDVPNHMNMNEEWWGVMSLVPNVAELQVDGRQPKDSFYILRELWTGKKRGENEVDIVYKGGPIEIKTVEEIKRDYVPPKAVDLTRPEGEVPILDTPSAGAPPISRATSVPISADIRPLTPEGLLAGSTKEPLLAASASDPLKISSRILLPLIQGSATAQRSVPADVSLDNFVKGGRGPVTTSLLSDLQNRSASPTFLGKSYIGDPKLQNVSFTYDQALLVFAFSLFDDPTRAQSILDFYTNAQRSDDVFYTAYDTATGVPWEYQVRVGPNAWIGLAALYYENQTQDNHYRSLAEGIGNWLIGLQDAEGGLRGGPDVEWYSTEHHLGAYVLFRELGRVTNELKYHEAMDATLRWLRQYAWNKSANRIARGKNDSTYATDVYNWAISSLGPERLQQEGFNPQCLMDVVDKNARVAINYRLDDGGSVSVEGYDFTDAASLGRSAVVSIEWTAQAVLAYWRLANYMGGQGNQHQEVIFRHRSMFYLSQLLQMVNWEGTGPLRSASLPYASLPQAVTGHGWTTPAGDYTSSIASTSYTLFALSSFDPLESWSEEKPYIWLPVTSYDVRGLVRDGLRKTTVSAANVIRTYDEAMKAIVFAYDEDFEKVASILKFFNENATRSQDVFFVSYRAASGEPHERVKYANPNVWMGLAAILYEKKSGDSAYRQLAVTLGDRLMNLNLAPGVSTGTESKITSNDPDLYIFFNELYLLTGNPKFLNEADRVHKSVCCPPEAPITS